MASVVGQARVILGVVRGACSSIVCDLMLLIEGCTQDELPERMLGGARWFPFFSFSLFLGVCECACESAHLCSSLPVSVSVFFVILRMCVCVLECVLVVRERATCGSTATN